MQTLNEIQPRPGSMDEAIIKEMEKDIYQIKDYVKNHDIVLDVGAYTGIFASFVKGIFPNTKIICIEPIPDNFTELKKNLGDSVIAEEAALMHKSGKIKMFDYGLKSSACHSIYRFGFFKGKKIEVKTITLEEIIKKNNIDKINYLKFDCQGSEFDIIPNINPGTLAKIDYIGLEVHKGIANTTSMLGYIPQSKKKIERMNMHLSKTHKLIQSNPDGTIQIWKNIFK